MFSPHAGKNTLNATYQQQQQLQVEAQYHRSAASRPGFSACKSDLMDTVRIHSVSSLIEIHTLFYTLSTCINKHWAKVTQRECLVLRWITCIIGVLHL